MYGIGLHRDHLANLVAIQLIKKSRFYKTRKFIAMVIEDLS